VLAEHRPQRVLKSVQRLLLGVHFNALGPVFDVAQESRQDHTFIDHFDEAGPEDRVADPHGYISPGLKRHGPKIPIHS